MDKIGLMDYNIEMEEKKECPRCSSLLRQYNGRSKAGSQRVVCLSCGKYYTLNPKTKGYSEEVRRQALKIHFAGASGRKVGQVMGFSKANVYNWCKQAKKNPGDVDK